MKNIQFFLFIILLEFAISWTPETLYKNYTLEMQDGLSTINKTILSKVIDPNGYIQNKQELFDKVIAIERNYNLSLLFIVIDRMDEPTFSWFRRKTNVDKIRKFTTDFENLYYNNNITLIDKSMTILFSIEDRKMRINAGRFPRKEFSNYGRQRLLDNIKSELRKKQYEKAFNLILNNILDYENFMYRHFFLIIAIIAVLFIFFCIGMYVEIKGDRERNFANGKISKINNMVIELHKGEKNVKDIISENCVVCLEKFIRTEEIKNSDNLANPLLDLKEEKQVIDLNECGHKLHGGCIEKWKEVEKGGDCPICFEKLRDDASPQELSEKVYNIQRKCHPILGNFKPHMNGGILSLND